jgi:hypothetical protein
VVGPIFYCQIYYFFIAKILKINIIRTICIHFKNVRNQLSISADCVMASFV